jgi:aryl carrier-like protein
MNLMTAPNIKVNIYDINYPCYVAAIPLDSVRVMNIPGEYEYKHLDSIFAYVVEAYKTKDKLYLADSMLTALWHKGICQVPFEKRIKIVRELVYSVVAKPDQVLDLDYVLIDNPAELNDYIENLLTYGYKTIRIMDVNGYYVFGESREGEYYELSIG